MIIGAHAIVYSRKPEADRAFLRDVLGFPSVDAGNGWLIFGLLPAEVAVHPARRNDVHELYLMCDDVRAFVAAMARRREAKSGIAPRRRDTATLGPGLDRVTGKPGEERMALSALDDRSHEPTDDELRAALGKAHDAWTRLIATVAELAEPLTRVWGFTGASTGWGLRLRRKERVIVYMTPQSGRFLVSFALGEKAVAAAHRAKLPASILKTIEAAPRYAEGRGVRFEVASVRQVAALARLARIKHEN